jgi:hypothetical protein
MEDSMIEETLKELAEAGLAPSLHNDPSNRNAWTLTLINPINARIVGWTSTEIEEALAQGVEYMQRVHAYTVQAPSCHHLMCSRRMDGRTNQ